MSFGEVTMPGLLDIWQPMQTTPEEEQAFQREWTFNPQIREWQRSAEQRWGLPAGEMSNPPPQGRGDYDYRRAVLNGVYPRADEHDGGFPHWGSEAQTMTGRTYDLKAPDHPTLWKAQFMQQFGVNPDEVQYQSAPEDQQKAIMDAYQRQGLLSLMKGGE
jgi:hypothetical protein